MPGSLWTDTGEMRTADCKNSIYGAGRGILGRSNRAGLAPLVQTRNGSIFDRLRIVRDSGATRPVGQVYTKHVVWEWVSKSFFSTVFSLVILRNRSRRAGLSKLRLQP